MADPKKLRLTFLWADPAALHSDFDAGYSEQLVDWAGKFYGKYGFELDVWPPPGDREAARAATLAEVRGYERDISQAVEHVAAYEKVMQPIRLAILRAWNEKFDLEQELARKEAQAAAELAKFGTLPKPGWPAQALKLLAVTGEWQALTEQVASAQALIEALHLKGRGVVEQFAYDQDIRNYDEPARKAIGAKMVASLVARGRAGGREPGGAADPIASERRLKVLFCRFRVSGAIEASGADAGPQPFGVTPLPISKTTDAAGNYVFGREFILVNVLRHERITLAHEIVHAAGRKHRGDFDRLKRLRKMIEDLRDSLKAGRIGLPTFYERVDGGYYDGPDDDIINYNSKGKAPEDVKLYDEKLVETSFFVKTA